MAQDWRTWEMDEVLHHDSGDELLTPLPMLVVRMCLVPDCEQIVRTWPGGIRHVCGRHGGIPLCAVADCDNQVARRHMQQCTFHSSAVQCPGPYPGASCPGDKLILLQPMSVDALLAQCCKRCETLRGIYYARAGET